MLWWKNLTNQKVFSVWIQPVKIFGCLNSINLNPSMRSDLNATKSRKIFWRLISIHKFRWKPIKMFRWEYSTNQNCGIFFSIRNWGNNQSKVSVEKIHPIKKFPIFESNQSKCSVAWMWEVLILRSVLIKFYVME